MASSIFKFGGDTVFSASHTAGEAIYLRSTAAGDDGAATVSGVETSADLTSESLTTAASGGQLERLTGNDYDSVRLVALPSGHSGTFRVYGEGTAAAGDITVTTNPSDGDTVTIGPTGFTTVYTFKNTLSTADQIKIGATAADTADNLKRALNDDGVAGTNYGTGTSANPYVSATVNTSVVSLADRVPCSRQLGWTLTQSAAALTLRNLSGGADGPLLATAPAGDDTISTGNGLQLESPALDVATLPETFTGNSAPVQVSGRCTIWIKCDTPGAGDVALKYQTSVDGENWTDGASSITNLATDQEQEITPTAHIQFARLVITSNTLTGPLDCDMRVIY